VLQARRDAEIIRTLRVVGPATVHDLAERLGVSASTVRRDLDRLGTLGALERVRGGARVSPGPAGADPGALPDPGEARFADIATVDAEDKDAVAARAAGLVRDGDVVLLDIGTTVQHLARHLRGRRITVVTSSLAVLDVLRDDPHVELILLGGVVRQRYLSMVGLLTETALGQVRGDVAFVGTTGVRRTGEVLDDTRVEVPVKRSLMAAADRSVLLADRHKFPGTGALKVCDVAELATVVTNPGLDDAMTAMCADAGTELVLA
jgi:DeoR/GlpR family transcriptional regulator of sugar metabolism